MNYEQTKRDNEQKAHTLQRSGWMQAWSIDIHHVKNERGKKSYLTKFNMDSWFREENLQQTENNKEIPSM